MAEWKTTYDCQDWKGGQSVEKHVDVGGGHFVIVIVAIVRVIHFIHVVQKGLGFGRF